MTTLFRKEAVEHATQRLSGDVLLFLPVKARVYTIITFVAVIAALVFATGTTYTRREIVAGWLTPARGIVRASAIRSGRLVEVLVQEGDDVRAGQKLAIVRFDENLGAGRAGDQILRSLGRRTEAEQRSAEAERELLLDDAQRVRSAVARMKDQRQAIVTQLELQSERAALAERELARIQELTRGGFTSAHDVNERKAVALQAALDVAGLQRSLSSLDRDIAESADRARAIPLQISAAEARSAAQRAELQEREREAEAAAEGVIVAPIAARIAALPARVGQAVQEGDAVAVLLPAGDRLMAEIYVPSRAIGFIQPRQEIRLMYQAFPYQRFGTGTGRITQVSTAVLAPREVAIPGLAVNEPVFRIEARLDSEFVQAYGQRVPLRSGMLLQASVIIDRRSLTAWLLDPLLAASKRR